MGREVGSWMRDVWQDAREFRHCRKSSSGRDPRRWDDHPCTLASRSVYTDGTHGVGAGNGVKGGNHFFREVSYCSHYPRFDTERDVPDVETSNWRAVCGKTASTVRREGRRKPSLPLSGATARPSRLLAPRTLLWPLDCFVARAPRNDGWGAADPIASVVIRRRLTRSWGRSRGFGAPA